jgi:hypothetical protein
MGSVNLRNTRLFERSQNTLAEFDREVDIEGVKCVLEKISNTEVDCGGRICYLYGMGAHPRSTYEALRKTSGLHVIFSRSILPRKLRFLSWIVASHEGLIRVDKWSVLPETFLTLMRQSMVALYFVSPELEEKFVCAATERGRKAIDFGVKADPGYSMYIVDADNAESSTGMVEIVSYGRATPPDLIPIASH